MHIFLILIHVAMMYICMMHLSMIHDPDTCVYDAFINVPRSLTLMHVCMMHISLILNLDSDAFMHVSFLTVMFVCMCDAQILDPDTCDHDAHTYYAFIHDPD